MGTIIRPYRQPRDPERPSRPTLEISRENLSTEDTLSLSTETGLQVAESHALSGSHPESRRRIVRRGLIFSSGLVAGLCMVLVLWFMRSPSQPAQETAASTVAVRVESAPVSAVIPTAGKFEAVPVKVEVFEPKVTNLPPIEANTYLSTGIESVRRMTPSFRTPQASLSEKYSESWSQVKLAPKGSADGRYVNKSDGLEWQAGWKPNDPDANIRLGSAYSEYLQARVGASTSQKLLSFENGRSSVLEGAAAVAAGPAK